MRYIPGPWIGVAVPGAAALVAPTLSADHVEQARKAMLASGVSGFLATLAQITADGGPSAGFAAVGVKDGKVTVAASGGGSVHEQVAQEPRSHLGEPDEGEDEIAWDGATGVRLVAPGRSAQAQGVLWLEAGVVFAGSIDVDLTAVSAAPPIPVAVVAAPVAVAVAEAAAERQAQEVAHAEPAPEPVPEPVPEPEDGPPLETMIPDFTIALDDFEEGAEPDLAATPAPPEAAPPAPPAPAEPATPAEPAAPADAELATPVEPAAPADDEEDALDLTFGDIWGATLAIDDLPKPAAPATPAAAAPVGPLVDAVPPVVASPSAPAPVAPAAAAPSAPPPAEQAPKAPAAAAPSGSGLIDGIPPIVRGPASTEPTGAVSASAPAVPVPSAGPVPAAAPAGPRLGDHDGSTVSVAEMLAMQANPPTAAMNTGTGSFSQRRRGRARLSTGQVLEIDRTIIVGRLPRASRVTGQPPMLVTVPSPEQDISRNHVEIRGEGGAVVVVDLNTTNGTVLLRAGADAERLHPGEPTVVRDGDIIDLGDNVTIEFEGVE